MKILCLIGSHDWRQQWVHMHLFNACRRCRRIEWAGSLTDANDFDQQLSLGLERIGRFGGPA